jgi:hypothetical protein
MKYAYINAVVNKQKKNNASLVYFQISSDDGRHFLFTENELKKAESRAKKNKEDLNIRNIEFTQD